MPRPPADKLVCKGEPAAPADASGAVQYMIDLRAAWFDCADALRWNRDYWAKLTR